MLTPQQQQQDDDIDLRELLRKIWRRRGIILGTIVVITVLAALVIFQLTPRYTASTLVMIGARENQVVDVEAVLSGLTADDKTIQSEIQVIQSRELAEKVVRKLRLDRQPEFNPALRPPSTWAALLDPKTYLPDDWIPVFYGAAVVQTQTEEELVEREFARVVTSFLGGLQVGTEGRSRVIRISYESENRQRAAQIADTVADFYIVAQLDAKFEATQRANEWLNNRLTELRSQVQIAEQAVEAFRKDSGLLRGKETTLAAQEVSELSTQLVIERTKRAEAVARLQQVEGLVSSPNGIETATEVLESPLIQNLRQQEATVERRAAELESEFGPRHPRMITVKAEMADLQVKIRSEVNRIIDGLRNEVAVARARVSALSGSLNELKRQMGDLNEADVQLRALEREADANRSLFETFLSRSKETDSQDGFQQADASIISRATIPDGPSFPRKKMLLAFAIGIASMTGIVLAFLVEKLDHGFRSMEQVESLMGAAPLGLVPALKGVGSIGKTPPSYILEKPASAYAEAVRSLHTNLLLSDVDKTPKVILLTSSLPREGKTSVAVSLANLMASVGKKVLVIDCDLRRPSAQKHFDCKSRPGLVECLLGQVTLEEAIVEHPVSGAELLPAGSPAPNPPDLLGSRQMKMLLESLAEAYDLVVIDSAPVMAVSDTRILARFVDKTVFLVRWADTRRETAIAGLRQVTEAGADVAGVLLSMVDVKQHASYGYSDSGYYYGRVKKYYTS